MDCGFDSQPTNRTDNQQKEDNFACKNATMTQDIIILKGSNVLKSEKIFNSSINIEITLHDINILNKILSTIMLEPNVRLILIPILSSEDNFRASFLLKLKGDPLVLSF